MLSDETIIVALAETDSIKKAAEMVGCSRSAIYNRFQNAEFKKKFDIVQNQLIQQTVYSMADNLRGVINSLAQIATDSKKETRDRIIAADTFLKHSSKFLSTLEDREQGAFDDEFFKPKTKLKGICFRDD